MSLLLALAGGAPPADGGIPWQPADWLVPEDDEDDDGTWIGAIYAAAFVQGVDAQAQSAEDEEPEDEPEQVAQNTPPLNEFIQPSAALPEDEEEDEPDWLAAVYADAPAAPATDFIASFLAEDDEEEDNGAISQMGGVAAANDFIASFLDDPDEPEEDDDAIAQIIGSVAAANEFIQSVLDAELDDDEDDGLFDSGWNAAFDPIVPPVSQPPVVQVFSGGNSATQGYRSERDERALRDDDEDLKDLAIILATFIREKLH